MTHSISVNSSPLLVEDFSSFIYKWNTNIEKHNEPYNECSEIHKCHCLITFSSFRVPSSLRNSILQLTQLRTFILKNYKGWHATLIMDNGINTRSLLCMYLFYIHSLWLVSQTKSLFQRNIITLLKTYICQS